MPTRPTTPSLVSPAWMPATGINHRFDKLGNRMALELHGCGCSMCAREQRALRLFWETE